MDAQVKIFQDYSLVQSVYTDDWCSEYLNNFDANVFDSVIDANEKSFNAKIRYATYARVNSAVETYIVVNNAGTTTTLQKGMVYFALVQSVKIILYIPTASCQWSLMNMKCLQWLQILSHMLLYKLPRVPNPDFCLTSQKDALMVYVHVSQGSS